MDSAEGFLVQPLVRCVVYCIVFIAALYLYGGVDRNTSKSVRQRIVSGSVACGLILTDTLAFTRLPNTSPWRLDSYDLSRIFLRHQHLVLALLLPTLSTGLLFLGPFWHEWRARRFYTLQDYARELWYTSNLIRLRNIVIAPLVEEIIFRGCILFHLQRRFDSCGALCLGSSLLFAVSHFHHVVERIYAGYAVREALLDVLSQVLMTAMFGAYSTLLVLRSGHLAAAFAVHSLCNLMGMPDIAGEMRVAEIHDPRWGRCVYKALLLVGFISWLVLIGPASTLFGLSDSTLCRLP
ncbi:CAAX prenyl protease 2 [Echinococcus granulosus]|uniref:CAAX prenyl protease 2 n=1 Tax=Echinococcus granulosus TaxID=6210 RepID=A0A068WTP2_ECHGR|nr:CAAX prenyl protease 2 [Echinococcus granulosus]CDS20995.1 CAAX prenyl protease 2 [Echinococcus granulosus]